MMGSKFKVGDRVRRTKASDWPWQFGEVGKEYTVHSVDCAGNPTVIKGQPGATASAFILLPGPPLTTGKHYRTRSGKVTGRVTRGDIGFDATVDGLARVFDHAGGAVFGGGDDLVEEWVPNVGDRVAYKDYQVSGEGVIHSAVRDSDSVSYDWNVTVDDADKKWAYYVNETCRRFRTDTLTPLPLPATLTIESGRYYKTRDGRKVGPMNYLRGAERFYENGKGKSHHPEWLKDGTNYNNGYIEKSEDLIALWPESTSTAAPVSVQVDAIADEYGSGGWGEWSEPKDYGASADNDNRLSITIDTSQTEAALDEIIKKLKKIRRLSAELGIDLAA